MRVLIVDDEAAARVRLRRLLEDLEADCVGETSNGLEALEHVRALAPDLLLLDIAMPEISGLASAAGDWRDCGDRCRGQLVGCIENAGLLTSTATMASSARSA
jgi:hypothetical protein